MTKGFKRKTEENTIINEMDDVRSRYTVSRQPIKVNVFFYNEGDKLKYTLKREDVDGKKFAEEWFEFNKPIWRIKNVINANSLVAVDGNLVINPFAFELSQIMFLLRDSSIDLKLKRETTVDGIEYIVNMDRFLGTRKDMQTTIDGAVIEAIKACIDTFYNE